MNGWNKRAYLSKSKKSLAGRFLITLINGYTKSWSRSWDPVYTTVRPAKKSFFSRFHGKPVRDIKQRLDVETEERVIDAVSQQTGLTFTEDTRPVEILFVTRE